MANQPARRRTQSERRNESEEALLAAAAELIAERGIDRASLARIGDRAGTSRMLPTYHFGSKDALVARVARRSQDHFYESMVAAVERMQESVDHIPTLELVRSAVDTYLQWFEQPTPEGRALLVMWGATFPSETSVKGMVEADQRSYEGWSQLIASGQDDGSIRTDLDPGSVAVLIQGMIRGVAALLLTDSEVTDMGRVRETCIACITGALAPMAANPQGRSQRRKPSAHR